jgi:membrane-associated phospholipid phosphatase
MEPAQSARLRRLAVAAAYAVVVAFLVTSLAYLIRVKFDPLVRFDEQMILDATSFTRDHPGFLDALLVWQRISQPLTAYLVVAVPVCLWVWLSRHLRTRAWWAFLTMMIGWMLALGLKQLVQRARPVVDDPVSQSPGYSFPSGHATNAAIISTTLVLLLWPLLGVVGRRVAVVVGVLWVTITCLDRVFLGVHYPTDVIGGVLLGCGLVLASYVGYRGWSPTTPARPLPDDPDSATAEPSSSPAERR